MSSGKLLGFYCCECRDEFLNFESWCCLVAPSILMSPVTFEFDLKVRSVVGTRTRDLFVYGVMTSLLVTGVGNIV